MAAEKSNKLVLSFSFGNQFLLPEKGKSIPKRKTIMPSRRYNIARAPNNIRARLAAGCSCLNFAAVGPLLATFSKPNTKPMATKPKNILKG